jgi:hypothetical protein
MIIAFGWGQKAKKESRNDRRRVSVCYFQSAGIGARSPRLNYKPHLKGKENEEFKNDNLFNGSGYGYGCS